MTSGMQLKILATCAVTALVALGFANVSAGGTGPDTSLTASHLKNAENPFPQPDTKSHDWRPISDDLGIWIANSDHVGMRGRLYVRIRDSWWPVAIDGAADIKNVFPAH